MHSVTLTPEQHARWVAAVAEWPTCQLCDGGSVHFPGAQVTVNCTCVAGRVPQPVVLVIEGDLCPDCHGYPNDVRTDDDCNIIKVIPKPCCNGGGIVAPVGWRVPAGEPVELRAPDPVRTAVPIKVDPLSPVVNVTQLVARATVELLPVTRYEQQAPRPFLMGWHWVTDSDRQAWWYYGTDQHEPIHRGYTFDPLPVPGRHWVAICTPVE